MLIFSDSALKLASFQNLAIAESPGCLVWWEANAENAIIVTAGLAATKLTTYWEHVTIMYIEISL